MPLYTVLQKVFKMHFLVATADQLWATDGEEYFIPCFFLAKGQLSAATYTCCRPKIHKKE